MTGFVYAIVDDANRVKIGWSGDPMRRLVKLRADCSGGATLLGIVPATKEQEKEAQDLLAPWCVGGEWFDLTARPVAEFVGMLPKPAPRAVSRRFGSGRDHPLAQYRAKHQLTLVSLAAKIGVSHANLLRYETRAVTPSPSVLKRIRAVTGISADDILGAA